MMISKDTKTEGQKMPKQWGDAKAIETVYSGYRFRSRLEARWAVFFDEAKVEWVYEPEGFDLDGLWYLPDFWLPKVECWVEIKPTEPSIEEREKCRRLCAHSRREVYVFDGLPGAGSAQGGVGFIPDDKYGDFENSEQGWSECPYCGMVGIGSDYGDPMYLGCCGKAYEVFREFLDLLHWLKARDNVMVPDYEEFVRGHRFRSQWAGHFGKDSPLLQRAYLMAKQARFEKGKR